ncbi:hypothetical protein M405DRAFT_817744 [Rhizopogon salebrosus TDB-379]|nr:hypothetical protein M405DRAFT_817744 [Rhizopogon salebrosus TDB-379]
MANLLQARNVSCKKDSDNCIFSASTFDRGCGVVRICKMPHSTLSNISQASISWI